MSAVRMGDDGVAGLGAWPVDHVGVGPSKVDWDETRRGVDGITTSEEAHPCFSARRRERRIGTL